jgi:hypothetical protein
MQWMYNYHKREHTKVHGHEGLNAQPPSHIVVPQHLANSLILDEVVNGDSRILVFMSEFGHHTLDNYPNEVSIDGTFSVFLLFAICNFDFSILQTSPLGFMQLFTVSALVDKVCIPCVYALLPSKEENVYVRLFDSIRNALGGQWQPNLLMTDYERGSINAVQAVFQNTTINGKIDIVLSHINSLFLGCLFHMGQSLYRHIQRNNILNHLYTHDENFQISMKCFQSLAFVPPEEVYTYLCILVSSIQPTPDFFEFLIYFVKTWVGPSAISFEEIIGPNLDADGNNGHEADFWIREYLTNHHLWHLNSMYPIGLWNVCNQLIEGFSRTNNSCEGWHRSWRSLFPNPNPKMSDFVRAMEKEDNDWKQIVAEFEASPGKGIRGAAGLRRRNIYIDQDNNLLALHHQFNQMDPLMYLRSISHHL